MLILSNGESHSINQHFHENGEKQKRRTAVATPILQKCSQGHTSYPWSYRIGKYASAFQR